LKCKWFLLSNRIILYNIKVALQGREGELSIPILFTSFFWILIALQPFSLIAKVVKPGIEVLISKNHLSTIKGKKIGIVTNHTAVNRDHIHTLDILKAQEKLVGFKLVAIFAPEHGFSGSGYADETIADKVLAAEIPIYSLYGKTRRPTDQMLNDIDLIIYDIQDIGSRSYTYTTTLFYMIEEASKKGIEVLVLDRPNPLGGLMIDGPMLSPELRSMVGYVNVPYCHGMTIGELAQYFNGEYKIGCKLTVIPMEGWQRHMTFEDTGLPWIPTSPQIPEASTVFFYPATGMLGELSLVSIGIGYTLPFKVVGAPWINEKEFALKLNQQKFPGVHFEPFVYRPFFGKYSGMDCHGVLLILTDKKKFRPVSTLYLLLGMIKTLYPEKFKEGLNAAGSKKEIFEKVSGNKEILQIISEKPYIIWPLMSFQESEREVFLEKRKPYLISHYGSN
jgi:uncharacterized protein YbbC (DUF1343 family)